MREIPERRLVGSHPWLSVTGRGLCRCRRRDPLPLKLGGLIIGDPGEEIKSANVRSNAGYPGSRRALERSRAPWTRSATPSHTP